jgi:hypothetical protein
VSINVLGGCFGQSDGMRNELIEKEWIELRVAKRLTNFIERMETTFE